MIIYLCDGFNIGFIDMSNFLKLQAMIIEKFND